MKNKLSFYYLFWIFLIGSVAGWVIEFFYTLIFSHVLINHSALVIGPLNVIYGFGACLLSALLYRFQDKELWKIFVVSFITGTVLEYICSWGMELVLGFTAWDYSNDFLNINGRVCLVYSLMWGFLGIIWIRYIYPWLIKVIDLGNYEKGKKLSIILLIFLTFDTFLTFGAIIRAKEKERGIAPSNMYEKILDQTFNQDYLKNMFSNSWS